MRTTFSGISIALRALQAQQVSLDITGHNVANANNPNYSRQTGLHSATRPYPAPMMGHNPSNGQLGTGVEISQINRMRDTFVDLRLRQQLSSFHYWSAMEDGLSQVELFFNEPGENGINQALDQFWDSLQDLSREPDFNSVREVVVQRAQVLVESITTTRRQLQDLRENINENIPLKVQKINSLSNRLADLNVQIGKISATGSLPNDLLDSRDAILEELSELIDIEVVQDHVNMVGVTVGGASLVHRSTAYNMTTVGQASEEQGYQKNIVRWATTGNPVEIKSGEIGGLEALRDVDIQRAIDDLDNWTKELVERVNEVHDQGWDLKDNEDADGNLVESTPFFVFLNNNSDFAALNIMVNEELANDVSLIRASSREGAIGNGENALDLARLRFNRVVDTGIGSGDNSQITIGDAFRAIVSKLGVNTQKSIKMVENDETLAGHLRNLKESVSGVSLDEEMANMIRFQHAYGAAARMMTAVDESLDTIINRLGIVGR